MSLVARFRRYGELVMWSHSVFSFSFLATASLTSARGLPRPTDAVLVIMAFLGARTCANALNRVIDKAIDAANPRTARRHLPSGTVSAAETWCLASSSFLVLSVSAFLLRPLCAALLPLAGGLFLAYSFSKRFTWLCHWLLGAICAGAPVGAALALRGWIDWPILILAAANAFWVAGFDIVYAVQDTAFDRAAGLKSIPARFGQAPALVIAAACHAIAVVVLALFGWSVQLGAAFFTAVALIALLLAIASITVMVDYSRFKTFAAYSVNKIVSLVLLAGVLMDFIILGRRPVWSPFAAILYSWGLR